MPGKSHMRQSRTDSLGRLSRSYVSWLHFFTLSIV